jgi:hypothetical protein
MTRTDAEYARELDRRDPLAGFRERFAIDGPEIHAGADALRRIVADRVYEQFAAARTGVT